MPRVGDNQDIAYGDERLRTFLFCYWAWDASIRLLKSEKARMEVKRVGMGTKRQRWKNE